MAALKPCPFCMSDRIEILVTENCGKPPYFNPTERNKEFEATCLNCKCKMGWMSDESALVAMWNKRPNTEEQKSNNTQQLKAAIEEAERAVYRIAQHAAV